MIFLLYVVTNAHADNGQILELYSKYEWVLLLLSHHIIYYNGVHGSKNNYDLTSETQNCPAGNQVESLVVLPRSAALLGRWPDVVSTGGGQTDFAVLPVRAVTEHHHSELQSRTCSEKNKSDIVTRKWWNFSFTNYKLRLLHQFHLKLYCTAQCYIILPGQLNLKWHWRNMCWFINTAISHI